MLFGRRGDLLFTGPGDLLADTLPDGRAGNDGCVRAVLFGWSCRGNLGSMSRARERERFAYPISSTHTCTERKRERRGK